MELGSFLRPLLDYLSRTSEIRKFLDGLLILLVAAGIGLSFAVANHPDSMSVLIGEGKDHVAHAFNVNVRQGQYITPILSDLRATGDGNFAGLVRYHNGQTGVDGLPFSRKSMTDSVTKVGSSDPTTSAQNLSTTADMEQSLAHIHHQCLYRNVKPETPYSAIAIANGVQSALTCPVFIPGTEVLVGYVAIAWQRQYVPTDGKTQTVDDHSRLQAVISEAQIAAARIGVVMRDVR